jgi:undecaprenyl-diphosphatase
MQRRRLRSYLATLAFIATFILLSILAGLPAVEHLDYALLGAIVSLRTEPLNVFFKFMSLFGHTPFFFLATPFLAAAYFFRRRWPASLAVIVTILGAWSLMEALKSFFRRPRPNLFPLENATGFSFPSGHAWMDTVFFGLLGVLLIDKLPDHYRLRVLVGTGTFLFLVGLSRLYLGVHYPTDVLAGYAGGLSILTLFIAWWRQTGTRLSPGTRHKPTSDVHLTLKK